MGEIYEMRTIVKTQRKFYFALIEIMQCELFFGKLSVDYVPCDRLREAMVEANVPASNAPRKTITFITENSVLVRSGYGATEKEIYCVDEIDQELQLLITCFNTERIK